MAETREQRSYLWMTDDDIHRMIQGIQSDAADARRKNPFKQKDPDYIQKIKQVYDKKQARREAAAQLFSQGGFRRAVNTLDELDDSTMDDANSIDPTSTELHNRLRSYTLDTPRKLQAGPLLGPVDRAQGSFLAPIAPSHPKPASFLSPRYSKAPARSSLRWMHDKPTLKKATSPRRARKLPEDSGGMITLVQLENYLRTPFTPITPSFL
mmetsp:Transcript_91449/g.158531  ORF Transcript_91449/g.158531 Transcript_91449/m.158531 type:complete len:210 (-) Transcript_91449:310-939(-)